MASPEAEAEAEAWLCAYAERSRTTVEKLRAANWDVFPCTCGEDGCEGWQAINRDQAETNFRVLGRY